MPDHYRGYVIYIWEGSEDWEQRFYYEVCDEDTGNLVFEGKDTFPKESYCLSYIHERIDDLREGQ